MAIKTELTKLLGIDFPLLMAPMFLVSNKAMMEEAMRAGIAACFPSLNYRAPGTLEQVINELQTFKDLNTQAKGSFGVNLIVQRSNPLYKAHLEICLAQKVPFYITSLGDPSETIAKAHGYGAKVFCDVTNIQHAKKCALAGADGFIAVGQGAGGHAGPYPLQILIPSLKKHFPHIPVIAAGGINTGQALVSVLALQAAGASVGTRFIASNEASVSEAYKKSIVDSGMDNIVLTEKLSGTPCTIINTPYAQKIGTKQNWFERLLSKNKTTKKYFKMLVQIRGMKKLEAAIKPGNYQNLWCAGQSVELIESIQPVSAIVQQFKLEAEAAIAKLQNITE